MPQIKHQKKKINDRNNILLEFPRAYFDGATQNGICAYGVYITMNEHQAFNIFWNGGEGTNNKAEAIALSGLLYFSSFLNIPVLHIYRDSQIIIHHVLGKSSIKNQLLSGWMKRIEFFWKTQKDYSIQHVDRSKNREADSLSKKGLSTQWGIWYMDILKGNITYTMEEFLLPGT